MDTHLLRISGKAELPKPVSIGHNFHVSLEGSIVSQTKSDNENGEFTYTYLFKPIKVDLLTDKGESLRLKDTRKFSQLFRARLWAKWKSKDNPEEFDIYYERGMMNMLQQIDEVDEMYFEKP